MTTWFTADHHFGHKNILRFCKRPWDNINDHDADLIERWNRVIAKGDTVYYLGDFSFLSPGYTKAILQKLHGKIHLIRGNHDKVLKGELLTYFESVSELKRLSINGQQIVVCHYPMLSWQSKYRGAWHLHGHSHGKCEPVADKMADVGVDLWDYTPVSYEQLSEHFKARCQSK